MPTRLDDRVDHRHHRSVPQDRNVVDDLHMPVVRPPHGLHALVIEDEPDIAEVVADYLQRSGFTVTVAPDGQEGVAAARTASPAVVILDLGLPSLDGVEVCRQLRTFTNAYIVMVTARADEVDTVVGLSVGADDYLTKPFRPRELMARIDAMLRRPSSSRWAFVNSFVSACRWAMCRGKSPSTLSSRALCRSFRQSCGFRGRRWLRR